MKKSTKLMTIAATMFLALVAGQPSRCAAPAAQTGQQHTFNYCDGLANVFEATISEKDYRIAAGDIFEFHTWGGHAGNFTTEATVGPDGNVFLPEIGAIPAAGMSIAEFRAETGKRVFSLFKDLQYAITLKSLHCIKVRILGQVAMPGWYTLPAQTKLSEAIQKTGGISGGGSYKNIILTHDNSSDETVCNLRAILNGDKNTIDPQLDSLDTIVIPQITKRINIEGQVIQPGIFELSEKTKLADIIREAGGPTMLADYKNSFVERNGTRIPFDLFDLYVNDSEAANLASMPGDRVFIGKLPDTVYVVGAVNTPGAYPYNPSTSVTDYMALAQGYKKEAVLPSVSIIRGTPDHMERIPVDVKQILKGTPITGNSELRPGDIIIVPAQTRMTYQDYLSVMLSTITSYNVIED